MKSLCIQIQPDRSDSLRLEKVYELGKAIASDNELVSRFEIVEGEDEAPYANLMFESANIQSLWQRIQVAIYGNDEVKKGMREASMALCEGEDGWNDYLLLFHFDPIQELESFDVR